MFRSSWLAREKDLGGYVRGLLADPDYRMLRDFQTHRLAMAMPGMNGSERERAFAAAEWLSFVGVVEAFDASIARLERLVRPLFPNFRCFPAHANASRPTDSTLSERIEALRSRLRTRDFVALAAANAVDLALHAHVAARYGLHLAAQA